MGSLEERLEVELEPRNRNSSLRSWFEVKLDFDRQLPSQLWDEKYDALFS